MLQQGVQHNQQAGHIAAAYGPAVMRNQAPTMFGAAEEAAASAARRLTGKYPTLSGPFPYRMEIQSLYAFLEHGYMHANQWP